MALLKSDHVASVVDDAINQGTIERDVLSVGDLEGVPALVEHHGDYCIRSPGYNLIKTEFSIL